MPSAMRRADDRQLGHSDGVRRLTLSHSDADSILRLIAATEQRFSCAEDVRFLVQTRRLAARLPAKGRLIGVDLGTKTIGLALSDVERRIATPLITLARAGFARDADALAAQIEKFAAIGLIIGLPMSAAKARFARKASR